MTVTQMFSANYQQARQKFLKAARVADARIESFENACTGVGGAGLFTDVATLGLPEGDHVLVVMSGTHGVEGFAGSAIQTGLLDQDLAGDLGPRTRVIMVHALNPYGFAFLRRVNEDNVDLNRNFIEHDRPYPVNREYQRLAKVIAPRSITAPAKWLAAARLLWYRATRGNDALQRAVTHGQYAYPEGLFFGGHGASWSNLFLTEFISRQLDGATRVAVIDLHTGLGPYGYGEIILNGPENDPAFQRAVAWWGHERVKSAASGQSVSAELSGTIKMAFTRLLAEIEVTAVGLEFGTLPPLQVFQALREENWLFYYGGEGHPEADRIKQELLRAFYPEDPVWRQQIWEQGSLIVKQALAALTP